MKIREKYDYKKNLFSVTLFSKKDLVEVIRSLPNNKVSLFENSFIKVL